MFLRNNFSALVIVISSDPKTVDDSVLDPQGPSCECLRAIPESDPCAQHDKKPFKPSPIRPHFDQAQRLRLMTPVSVSARCTPHEFCDSPKPDQRPSRCLTADRILFGSTRKIRASFRSSFGLAVWVSFERKKPR